MPTKRVQTIGMVVISCVLIGACTRKAASVGPKFSGRLLLLAGENTNGANLVELTTGPNSTYNYSVVTSGVFEAAASPDRTRLLYTTKDGILLRDLRTGAVKPLVKGENYCLAWSPDGKHFSYKQKSAESRMKLFASDLDGKPELIWEDQFVDQGHFGCPHWVAPDRFIFERLLGALPPQKKGGETPKPNTTTMAILSDSVKLIDTDRKWSIEGICQVGSEAFVRSADQNELLIAKNLDNLKTVSLTSGPCSGCRFLGFAAHSCVPFFIEDSSSTSSELFSLNPINWQRQRGAHIGQTFSSTAKGLINSAARLMVVGDIHGTLVLVDTETGEVSSFFAKSAGPPGTNGELLFPVPVVWIEN